jgi:hypothetical protein
LYYNSANMLHCSNMFRPAGGHLQACLARGLESYINSALTFS